MRKNFLKSILSVSVFFFTANGLFANAEVGEQFILNNSDGVELKYEILDGSSVALIPNGYKDEINVPEIIEYEGNTYTVTKLIGSRLFNNGVTKVTLPKTVTDMIADGSVMFYNITVPEIILPENLVNIKGGLLKAVRGFSSIVIPDKVKEINTDLIVNAYDITELTLGASVSKIDSAAFSVMGQLSKIIVKAKDVPEASEHAFEKLQLGQITLEVPKGCKSKYEAVSEWNVFKEIVESEDGSDFKSEVFNVTMNGVDFKFETLDETTVSLLPNNYVGEIIIPETVEYSGKVYTVTKLIADGARFFGRDVSRIEFPSTITDIIVKTEGDEFIYGSSIEELILPESLENIEGRFLEEVKNISKLVIPNKVREIKTGFISSSSLTEIVLGSGIEKIDSITFEFMSRLKKIEMLATEVPELSDKAFSYLDPKNITLQVPVGCKEKYEASESWRIFKEIVEGAGGPEVGDDIVVTDENGMKLKYNIIEENTLALIENSYAGNIEIPSSLVYMDTSYDVKEIRGDENGIVPVFGENVYSVSIPEGIETLYGLVFDKTNITELNLPESLTAYGELNFRGLSKLQSLTLPSIQTVETRTLSDCTGLKELIFKYVNNIEADAFYGCSGLERIKFEQNIVPNAMTGAFNGLVTGNITVLVPSGTKKAYELNWGEYGFKGFEEYGLTGINEVSAYEQCKIVDGGIVLPDLNYCGYVCIYNVSGELLLRTFAIDGFVEFNAIKGFYLIKVDNCVYKLYVK